VTDVTIIVESGLKGGSMITAEIADSYHRDVFAVPGRIGDTKSSGCNDLIKRNKAVILNDPEEIPESLGWLDEKPKEKDKQKKLFIELSEDESKIVRLLKESEMLTVDELNFKTGISNSSLAASLLNLEMNNVIRLHPGKRYSLAD
jgi:DNA processing protein